MDTSHKAAFAAALNDPDRLASLAEFWLAEGETDQSFDRLTRLACRILNTPIALVSLIGSENQFFKSSFGLPEPWKTRGQVPLSHSFCQYVVVSQAPFIVEDARRDERVGSESLAYEMDIVAYAGMPLTTKTGHVIGAFCVIDTRPRQWKEDEIEIVRDLAAEVMTEIELRDEIRVREQAEIRLEQTTRELQAMFEAFPDLAFHLNRSGKILTCYGEDNALFQDRPPIFVNHNIEDILPPEVSAKFREALEAIGEGEELVSVSYSLTLPEGEKSFEARLVPLAVNGEVLALVRDITKRRRIEQKLAESNRELQTRVRELEERTAEIGLLAHMAERLQASQQCEQAEEVVTALLPQFFKQEQGTIYFRRPSQNTLERVAQWGGEPPLDECFQPSAFPSLQHGCLNLSDGNNDRDICEYLRSNKTQGDSYVCVPLQAQDKILGLLHLSQPDKKSLNESKRGLALAVAEQIALALANLHLQETLRQQTIRDPLTNLYNRRYMEESLDRELSRAQRHNHPLGIVMMDIDHFKRFNDTHGHVAGDALLETLGQFLLEHVRGGDIACRYGGEELTLILPEAGLKKVYERAEKLREEIGQITVEHRGQTLGPVTISMGVASFPQHGPSGKSLLETADKALYAAKDAGRNRVMMAEVNSVTNGAI